MACGDDGDAARADRLCEQLYLVRERVMAMIDDEFAVLKLLLARGAPETDAIRELRARAAGASQSATVALDVLRDTRRCVIDTLSAVLVALNESDDVPAMAPGDVLKEALAGSTRTNELHVREDVHVKKRIRVGNERDSEHTNVVVIGGALECEGELTVGEK